VKFIYVEATPKFTIAPPSNLPTMTDAVVNIELTKNGLELTLRTLRGSNGHIEVSSDLLSWETLADFTGTNTTLIFRDPAATNFTSRFYRAVAP
jgi:hypothetical protein